MRPRLLSLGVLVLFSTGLIPLATAADGQFSDAYNFLASTGAISNSDTWNSYEFISRAELLKVLLDARVETRLRVEATRQHLSKLSLFVDVSPTDWYAPYAEAAFMSRITTGFTDRTLRPADAVPVEEAITLLMRAYRQEGEKVYSDTQWFAPFVRGALGKNVVAQPNLIALGQPVMRGQFFDMVYRMSVIERDGLVAFAGPQPGRGVPAGASPVVMQQQPVQQQPVQQVVRQQPVEQPTQGAPVIVAAPTGDPNVIREHASSRGFAISIPILGIRDLLISHPEDSQSSNGLLAPLKDGLGHLFSYPGKGGKIMVYGHSSGYSWDVSKYTKIFQQVNKLKKGDMVYVTYNGNLYAYSVTGQETISPKDARPFTGAGEELILYTCWPVGSNKSRLIVRAVPVETIAFR